MLAFIYNFLLLFAVQKIPAAAGTDSIFTNPPFVATLRADKRAFPKGAIHLEHLDLCAPAHRAVQQTRRFGIGGPLSAGQVPLYFVSDVACAPEQPVQREVDDRADNRKSNKGSRQTVVLCKGRNGGNIQQEHRKRNQELRAFKPGRKVTPKIFNTNHVSFQICKIIGGSEMDKERQEFIDLMKQHPERLPLARQILEQQAQRPESPATQHQTN